MDLEKPNGATKNEIDFIIRNKNNSISNVTVNNKVNIGINHRMVGWTTKFNFRSAWSKLVLRKKICSENKIKANKEAFQLELQIDLKLSISVKITLMK